MKRTISSQIPEKLKARLILQSSGLKLNKQKWFKAKDCLEEVYEIVNSQVKDWPNVSISTALMKESKMGSSPLIKPCDPKRYEDKEILRRELENLRSACEKYNGNKGWDENDYIRLFSSPLGINHLFVGISVHFDVSQYMKKGWGKVRTGFSLMPVLIEAQQGTWPRYFNAAESEQTIENFLSLFFCDPHRHWKDEIVCKTNGNFLVAKAVSEALSYVCSIESQIKIFNLANIMNYKWIGFDSQYIDDNDRGHQIGFAIYDFCGF